MAIFINDKAYDSLLHNTDYSAKHGKASEGKYDAPVNTKAGSMARGTYHMADNSHLYEVQRSNNFEFVVFFNQDLARAGLVVSESFLSGREYSAQEVLRMSVSEAFIPHFTQNAVEVKRGNTTIKYAGTPEFQGGELTLNDYIGADTKSVLMAWQNLSYNVGTERVGLASDYKKEALLIEYTPDLQQVRQWHP